MKTLQTIGVSLGCLLALTVCLHAGSVQSVPPYNNTSYAIAVGPGSDGTANVIFKVTSSDSNVTVSGTFNNATNSSPSFTKTGNVYAATANYPVAQAGHSNTVSIMITTQDGGHNCTTSIFHPISNAKNPFASFCFGGNSNCLANIVGLVPSISSFRSSLMSIADSSIAVKEIFNFKVFMLKPDTSYNQ